MQVSATLVVNMVTGLLVWGDYAGILHWMAYISAHAIMLLGVSLLSPQDTLQQYKNIKVISTKMVNQMAFEGKLAAEGAAPPPTTPTANLSLASSVREPAKSEETAKSDAPGGEKPTDAPEPRISLWNERPSMWSRRVSSDRSSPAGGERNRRASWFMPQDPQVVRTRQETWAGVFRDAQIHHMAEMPLADNKVGPSEATVAEERA